MRRLLAIALVALMGASVASAQGVLEPSYAGDWDYSSTTPRDSYVYLENTPSRYFMPMGNYGLFGIADDIQLGGQTNMTSFEVGWYSRITAPALPLTMEVNFYSYWTVGNYIYFGEQYGPSFVVDGLGTGNQLTQVTVDGPPVWLPCNVWMEVGFYDNLGNYAVDTGVNLADDWMAEVGITSHDYYMAMGFTRQKAEPSYFFTLQAAPSEGIHWMTEQEIQHYKLTTQQ